MTTNYNPAARYEIKVSEVEFRRTPKRTLMARIYQPHRLVGIGIRCLLRPGGLRGRQRDQAGESPGESDCDTHVLLLRGGAVPARMVAAG